MGDRICSVEGCGKLVKHLEWCGPHYHRNRKYGSPTGQPPPREPFVCAVPDCRGSSNKGHGYCSKHYQRFKKYGSPTLPERERPLCAGPGCTRTLDPIQNKTGLCHSHYKQWILGKPLTPLLVATKDLGRPEVCTYPGCGRPHKARGYCKSHAEQVKRGNPLTEVAERLGPGPCAIEGCDAARIAIGICAKHYYTRKMRWSRYNISPDEAQAMYEAQGGRCAICRVPKNIDSLHVDHDHRCCAQGSCGRCVRGFLCSQCNTGIGMLGDDRGRLLAAADYLARAADRASR